MMLRKGFGLRRALGASRSFSVSLILLQTAFVSFIGIAMGMATSAVVLIISHDPLPGLTFSGALAMLTLITTLIATLLSAFIVTSREPIRELRIT